MKMVQAVGSGRAYGAYRVVGTQRILVELSARRLRVLVQCRSGRRWMLPDPGGSVRYLNGVLKEMDGSWIVACGDLAAVDSVANCLPAIYQHLLTPDSDDWHPLERKQGDQCQQGSR